ncbi:MAG: metallophosphoesterase [Clostridia bacterium]|nr:metallophosphoesterase [Clostridia bacterium]
MEDEIKQINEIINKLDIIQDNEWIQKEGETEEEYNNRIESIEEELEEELLDYISDSLLDEQKINEEEAIKEAQEKIKSDYELFSDAFTKNEDGTITLKSDEELASLRYDTPEEIEKLKEIENNMNNPEQYLNKIKESIKASKDIDSEIDRKMELAKSIITAKKRGETITSSLNPNLEKDKFEKANEYIANTTTLKRIPTIQHEYISNNYIAERRYNNVVRNVNNTVNRNNSNSRITTSSTTQTATPVVSTPAQKIVTKKIPERKNTIYTNFEKKLDKDNDLTKQKIKARTELKSIFKEIEDKELSKEELEELNSKIESIKKKYPNTVTDKTLDKLYDTFKVKLPAEKPGQQSQNIESEKQDGESELLEVQERLEEELEKMETATVTEPKEEQKETAELQQQAKEVIDSIASISATKPEDIKTEPKVDIKVEPSTSKIRQKATDVALGALQIGGAIGATIGTLRQKSGEIIDNIVQQQKDTRKKRETKPKKETPKKADKVETPKVQVVSTPIKTEPSKSEENKAEKKEEIAQTEVTSKNVSKNSHMSREELVESLKRAEAHSVEYTHAKGINLLIINKLISYLKDNDDPEIQERLNKEIVKLQTDRFENKNQDKLFIYEPEHTYLETLNYMYECYKNGKKSADGSRDIIPANQNAASYYLYLANNVVQELGENGKNIHIDTAKDISCDFNTNKEETCYRYFKFLKEKYNIDKLKGVERLKAEHYFISELSQAKKIKCKTEYLDLAIAKELAVLPSETLGLRNSEELYLMSMLQIFEEKIKNGEKIDSKILKLWGDIYYKGLKKPSEKDIIVKDYRKATKIYEQIINGKETSNDAEIYNNLIDIYSDVTTPLYNKTKATKLMQAVTKKRLRMQKKSTVPEKKEPSTFVCSDLHGEYLFYKAITSQLKESDKLYILGDVIDRGEDGIKILRDVMKRKEQGQVEFLIGNHEFMMIQSLFLGDEERKRVWTTGSNGGDKTLKAFEELKSDEQNKIKEFLLDSYVYKNINVNSQNIHLVHSKSIQDKNDNGDKTVREMIAEGKEKLINDAVWGRGNDGNPHPESAKPGTFTVIGHSPTENNRIKYKNGFMDIDCGGGYHYASLVNLTKGTVKYFGAHYEQEKENNKPKER